MASNCTIPALDNEGDIPAYCARPEGTPRAAILVIPEIFGVNPGNMKKCDDWASMGYLAICPDIFWRFAAGVELDPDVESEFKQALENMGKFDPDLCVKDIEAITKHIRAEEDVEKVGLVGFCLGGRMAYMAAARTDIDASVGYYGVTIDQMLDEAHAIANSLMLHVPTADHFVGPDAQKAIHEALDPHPRVTIYDYEGLDHGFATTSGNRRDEEGATLADKRTVEFFAETLG